MQILIIKGNNDLVRNYIYDQGIGLNFIKVMDIDTFTDKEVREAIHESALNASVTNKGVCFKSNRKEIQDKIIKHFENDFDFIELIEVNSKNSIIATKI